MSSKYSLHVYIQAIIYQRTRKCKHKTHTDIHKYAYIVHKHMDVLGTHEFIHALTHTSTHIRTRTHTHARTHT